MTDATPASGRRYEMMFIIQPNATEAQRTKALKEVKAFVAETGAKIFHEDDWGLKDMAYRIKGFDQGYYYIYYFDGANGEKIAELDHNMRLEQDVVRHMVVKVPDDYEVTQYNANPANQLDEKELDEKLDEIMKADDLKL